MPLRDVIPVLLAGGATQNFWPVARASYPWQFAKLGQGHSPFQTTAQHLSNAGLGSPVVVTPGEHSFVVTEQLAQVGQTPRSIVVEPAPRDTTAAICAAAEVLATSDPEALILLILSDRTLPTDEDLAEAVQAALPHARAGHLVTFGFPCDSFDSGLSYIEMAQGNVHSTVPQPVAQYIDQPVNLSATEAMVETKRYLCSANIVLVTVKTLRGIYGRHAASIRAAIRRSVRDGKGNNRHFRLSESYEAATPTSFGKAILEHQQGMVVPIKPVPLSVTGWHDVWKDSQKDGKGNAIRGNANSDRCENSLLRSDADGVHLVGVGLKNIAVIATGDAILAVDLTQADRVAEVVAQMERQQVPQARDTARQTKPWGKVETLLSGARHRVRSVEINPGAAIPVQAHLNRTENWVVVEGTGRIWLDGQDRLISETDSVLVPVGREYSIENPGKVALRLIETQTGPYLGDDDVTERDEAVPVHLLKQD